MNELSIIGQSVMERQTKSRGIIAAVDDDIITVSFHGQDKKYRYPEAFAAQLVFKDPVFQKRLENDSYAANFRSFKKLFIKALDQETLYLKRTGGKHYKIFDGERLNTQKGGRHRYTYCFDTDTEFHFPDGTSIKIYFSDQVMWASVVSCEEYSIVFETAEYIGEKIDSLEFTAEPWQLLEALVERIKDLDFQRSPIAYALTCQGKMQMRPLSSIKIGQDTALRCASNEKITIVWGPPGTGKTTTLARIAMEAMHRGERVLMLSYSNVSVDGAILKVAGMTEQMPGQVIRYGYPRDTEVSESKVLSSYLYVLSLNPELEKLQKELYDESKRLSRKKDPESRNRRIEIKKELAGIRSLFKEKERELIQRAGFVATTVSKAVSDMAVYSQRFDTVIFDEASMAYVPQVVFAAGLAKKHFVCLGDFRQLPAIVQNPENSVLKQDIFEYTGVTAAVENGYGHKWTVMLNEQHRMHPDIAYFASENMYKGMLYSAKAITASRQQIADLMPLPSEAIGMIDLSSMYSVCIKTSDGSRLNLMSAMTCVKLAELFAGKYEVGIITPYTAQARLLLAMIRDVKERDERFGMIKCSTVHQFQGSEKAIIIYDAVDCFRMPYPGTLLTSKKNDVANRLFNVALTRAQGKFILVVNSDYMTRKNIAKDLMFAKLMNYMDKRNLKLIGDGIIEEMGTLEDEQPHVFLGGRDESDSWNRFLKDVSDAEREIYIEIPGPLDDDAEALGDFLNILKRVSRKNVSIYIKYSDVVTLPKGMRKYGVASPYVTTPFTLIDGTILWYGEPLAAPDFISEGKTIQTKVFPCYRFSGINTGKMIKTQYDITMQMQRIQL